MNIKDKGISYLQQVYDHFSKNFTTSRFIFIESCGPVESIEMTAYVRHLRSVNKQYVILWGISESIYKQFDSFALQVPCVFFKMPDNPSLDDRKAWINYLIDKKLHVFSSINGKIKSGHKPLLPHEIEDYQWHDNFISSIGLVGKKIVITEGIDHLNIDGANIIKSESFPGTIRQLKVAIERAACCAITKSGLVSTVCSCEGVNVRLLSDPSIDNLTNAINGVING